MCSASVLVQRKVQGKGEQLEAERDMKSGNIKREFKKQMFLVNLKRNSDTQKVTNSASSKTESITAWQTLLKASQGVSSNSVVMGRRKAHL